MEGMAATAMRPVDSDRMGLLFSYTHRSTIQNGTGIPATRDRLDSLSTDGYDQLTKRLELYGHFALRFSANGQPELPYVSSLSFLLQARCHSFLTRRIVWRFEPRSLFNPPSALPLPTHRRDE